MKTFFKNVLSPPTPWGPVCESFSLPPSYSPPSTASRKLVLSRGFWGKSGANLGFSPPPLARLWGHWGPPGAWIWASDSLLGASGSVSSRLQRFLVLMLWFGNQFFRGFGCSKLDFFTFQGVGGMAEPLNPPHCWQCPGVSDQCVLIYM